MGLRSGIALALAFLCAFDAMAAAPRTWRIYRPNPDLKISVCYPTDLLHPHHNKPNDGVIDLSGAGGAQVLLNARPDKYTDLKSEMEYSLEENLGGPRWVHESGPGLTPVHFFNFPKRKVTTRILNDKFSLFRAENKKDVVIVWAVHLDQAIRSMEIQYPKSQAAAWRGVPERMRACFKSLGPITNPMIH